MAARRKFQPNAGVMAGVLFRKCRAPSPLEGEEKCALHTRRNARKSS